MAEGGTRLRLVQDSYYRTIRNSLTALGWFGTNRGHAPVTMRHDIFPNDVNIPVNTVAVVPLDLTSREWELGNETHEQDWIFYVDVYGENEAFTLHIAGDIEAILKGEMPSIGRTSPFFQVWDYRLATPVPLFSCEIEDVRNDKPEESSKPWLRHWRSIRSTVIIPGV